MGVVPVLVIHGGTGNRPDRRRILAPLITALILLVPSAAADTIRFSDGTEFPGSVVKETPDELVIQLPFGTMQVKPGEVQVIKGPSEEGAAPRASASRASERPKSPASSKKSAQGSVPASTLPQAMAAVATIRIVMEDGNEGAASGTIIGPDGLIVTNYHVVDGAKALFVSLPHEKPTGRAKKQREYQATVLKTRQAYDLALIDIRANTPYYLQLAEAEPAVGTEVQAIGNPLGLATSVSKGIVSAIRTNQELGLEYRPRPSEPISQREFQEITWIQTDASVNPGNSGGPLLGPGFAVIGINTFGLQLLGSTGLNFALDAKHIRKFVPGSSIK